MVVDSRDVQAALANADLVADVAVDEVTNQPHSQFFTLRLARAHVLSTVEPRKSRLARNDEVIIETPGGERDGVGVFITGFPRLYRGDQYRVHLKQKPNGHYEIAGWEEGVQTLSSHTRTYSRNRTDGSNGDGSGPFLYWDDRSFPIPYYISAPTFAGLPSYVPAIDASFHEWASFQDVKVDFVAMGCTNKIKNENDGVNSVILVRDNWGFDSAAIAITRNFYVSGTSPSAGMILDSDILLNAVDHDFTTTNEPGKHDVQNIVTHEVGHFIGMGHEVAPADSHATMYAVASPNEFEKRDLDASDLQGLYSAYAGVPFSKQPTLNGPSCEVFNTGGGCLAAHHRETDWNGAWGCVIGMLFLFGMASVLRRAVAH